MCREYFTWPLIWQNLKKNVKVGSCRQRHRGHQGGRDCKTYLMRLADSQKEDITINRTAKWELSPQTYKLSRDSSCGLTSAWEIKYPGSRCSYNQWCYFLYFKLPLAVRAVFKNKVRHLSSLQFGPELDQTEPDANSFKKTKQNKKTVVFVTIKLTVVATEDLFLRKMWTMEFQDTVVHIRCYL